MQTLPRVPAEPLAVVEDIRDLLIGDVPLIDLRAPVEFARGAFPGAINLPLMNDEERHLVGMRYKQAGEVKAIELGAELVDERKRESRRDAWCEFLETHPDAVLYCFRGGHRSRMAQAWLEDAGVLRPLVAGGYKAMRQYLIDELVRLCSDTSFLLVAGRTGCGKTQLLNRVERHIDLEGIARHRGSSFGGMAVAQPSPVDVENEIAIALLKLEQAGLSLRASRQASSRRSSQTSSPAGASVPTAAVWLEDEAKLIGRVCLPPVLRDAMAEAPAVVLEASMATRIANCYDDYVPDLLGRYRALHGVEAGFDAFAAHHRDSLDRIKRRLGTRHAEAVGLLDGALTAHREQGDTTGYAAFIELLLTHYYDPMYDYQLAQKQRRVLVTGCADAILDWAQASSDRTGTSAGGA